MVDEIYEDSINLMNKLSVVFNRNPEMHFGNWINRYAN
jgi:hypothetical protein